MNELTFEDLFDENEFEDIEVQTKFGKLKGKRLKK